MKTDQFFRCAASALDRLPRQTFTCAVALVILLLQGSSGYSQIPDTLSYFDLPTLNGAVRFTQTFGGNVSSQFQSESTSDPLVDPFANPADIGGGLAGDASGNVSYDSVHNLTNVTFLGDPINTSVPTVGLGLKIPTTGTVEVWNPISQSWGNSAGDPLQQLPLLTVASTSVVTATTPISFATLYLTVSGPGGTLNEWFEVPYNGASPPLLKLTVGSQPVTLFAPAFGLTNMQVPLDDIKVEFPVGLEPLGNSLPSYNGAQIPAGGSITVTLPEPSSLSLIGMGTLCAGLAAGYRCWRRLSKPNTMQSKLRTYRFLRSPKIEPYSGTARCLRQKPMPLTGRSWHPGNPTQSSE
jgi:hypothetical protein